MNAIKSNSTPPQLQPCTAVAFFAILDRIDLTTLKDAVTGPKRRGPRLKRLDATVRLILWYFWSLETQTGNPPTVAGLRRELEDPDSELASLCRFGAGEKLPDRKTISNHIRRISEHPDLVRDVQSAIGKMVAYTPLPPSEKSGKESDQGKDREPKSRNEENVDYRRRRRQEALGDDQFAPVIRDEASAYDFMLGAIHGDRPTCRICSEKRQNGWECTKNHVHGAVVEMKHEPDQSRQWKCRCCGYRLDITRGTAFHGTHFSCRDILKVLRYMVHSRFGISALEAAGHLNSDGRNASEGGVRDLMHRLRECMREELDPFEGESEFDEMLLRLDDGTRVSLLVLYNRPTRRVRMEIVERKGGKKPKANQREILKFLRRHTKPGSIILTDGDASIPKPEVMRREHGSVNHKRLQWLRYSDLNGILEEPIEVTTNRTEGKQGFARRTLRVHNSISRYHLERYLLEVMWRMNRLHNRIESQAYDDDERRNLSLMRDVLAGAAGRKITLKDLRGEPQKKRHKSLKRTRTAPATSHEKPEQQLLLPPKIEVVRSNPAPSGPLEEREQTFAA